MKNFLKQLLIGAIAGFIAVTVYLLIPFNEWTFPIRTVIIILYVIVLVSFLYCLIVANKIKHLAQQNLVGDAEDEAEEFINKKMFDYSFSNNTGATLAILGLSLAVIANATLLVTIGAILSTISYFIMSYMMKLMKLAYPNRNLPEVGEKHYAQKLMEVSDEGERHVMLHGLYKVYNFANMAFAFSIIGIAIYTSITGDSQLFSMIVIAFILLVMNSVYSFSVRNK